MFTKVISGVRLRLIGVAFSRSLPAGLLQIPAPPQEESTAAAESVRKAIARLESRLFEPLLA